jgi:arylsulfatase A-like enzyme
VSRLLGGWTGALLAGLAGLVLAGCGQPRWDHNIVLIVIDTLRVEGLPFYGGRESTAPFLHDLAREGLVFERAWSTSSWTAPATASIFTSTHPNEHGVIVGLRAYQSRKENIEEIRLNRIPESFDTIPAFLRRRGYRTFGVSGNLNVDATMGFSRGFDRFEMIDYHEGMDARTLISKLLEWRDEIRAAQPFFVYVQFMDPHAPFHRQREWVPSDAPPPTPGRRLEDRVAYDSEIRLVDEQIRRLFGELDLDEALVIVTSDHGQEFDDHGSYGHGYQLYSELTQVPLVLRLPGGPTGRVARPVSSLDILPTLRSLLGAAPSEQDRGLPLVGPDAPKKSDGRSFFSMRARILKDQRSNKRAVVHAGLKLIVTEPDDTTELYDLTTDPGEQHDLSAERPADVAALRALIDAQDASADVSRYETAAPVEVGPALHEMLERLGYIEEDGS